MVLCVADKEVAHHTRDAGRPILREHHAIRPPDLFQHIPKERNGSVSQVRRTADQTAGGRSHCLLLRLINAGNEIGSTLALENFILGFRLGTRLILEALDEDDGSLMELLRRDGRREEQG